MASSGGENLGSYSQGDSTDQEHSVACHSSTLYALAEKVRFPYAQAYAKNPNTRHNANRLSQVHEATQKQVQGLEEEARTRMQSDEARALRFRQSIEGVSGEVQMIANRLAGEEKGTLQRIANLEVNDVPRERACYVWGTLLCLICD